MKAMRKTIRLGTHGEQYGNWMPVSMLSLMGGLLALAAVSYTHLDVYKRQVPYSSSMMRK